MYRLERRSWCRHAVLFSLAAAAIASILLFTSCSGGWGAVGRSVLDRVVPGPEITMWAQTPQPDASVDSYSDATGAGTNYVYEVDAVTEQGDRRELTIISFGGKATGEGYLEIDAKGGSGIRYRAVDEADVPERARAALQDGEGSGLS